MKILAVEDEPITGMLLAAALRALDHTPTLVADARQALAQLDREPYRLIVCDWRMSGMDGMELCRQVRARGGEYVYFILISTANASPENRDAALAAGVDDFLTKPLAPDELRMRIHVAQRILQFTSEVRQLEACLPICSYCHKVRTDPGYWTTVEDYLSQRTGMRLTHSVCPECYQRHLAPGDEDQSGASSAAQVPQLTAGSEPPAVTPLSGAAAPAESPPSPAAPAG